MAFEGFEDKILLFAISSHKYLTNFWDGKIKGKTMRYTINLDCKTKHVGKDGTFPILLRVSINGVHDYINIGKKIKEEHYLKDEKKVKPGITGYTSITSFIDRQKTKIDDIIKEFVGRDEIVTVPKVKELYNNKTGKVKSISFYDFVEETIKYERENTDISSKTLNHYDTHLKKLKTYKKKLTIHEINKAFLQEYKSYIKDNLKQADNTAYHAMCFLRKYTKKLFDDGKISRYPFTDFQVGKPFETEQEHLEPEEISKLHDLYDSKELLKIVKKSKSKYSKYKEFNIGEKYQEVLRYALVACYCGLRHSDIKSLRTIHIKGNMIVKEMQKGRLKRKKTVRIPIRKRLLSLLDLNNSNGLIFESTVMENSQTNKYLKAIMKIAGINKHITFHCLRHTFAITALLLGMKIEVVCDILGHSELSTTQRYARIVDKLRESEMDKWDKMVKEELNTNLHQVNCPKCENMVISFEKNVIQLNKLVLLCQFCSTPFSYNLKGKMELAKTS